MTTIYLIRHAQADGNLYRRCQAWYDGLITPIGYKQIEALKDRFIDTHFDAVYSSDLFRTMMTARAIYEPHNLPLNTDPELREIGSGCWEDRPWGELLQTDRASLLAFWRCDPEWHIEGSETFSDIQLRFDKAVRRIASNHPNQTIAIFAHGCIIRSTLAYWLGLPPDSIRKIPHGDNTSVAKLEFDDGSLSVCWYNDISHLSGELARAPHPAAETDEATAAGIERSSLYFSPMDLTELQEYYIHARIEAWESCGKGSDEFDITNVLLEAKNCKSPNLLTAFLNREPVGVLQMDTNSPDAGYITFMYLIPELRNRRLGVQLIGQAVSTCRALGLRYLRLTCPPENEQIHSFLYRYGFQCLKQASGCSQVFEKYIGY